MPVLSPNAVFAPTTRLSDVIEETLRRLVPAQLDLTVNLGQSIGPYVGEIPLTGNLRPVVFGTVLSMDMELMYVTAFNTDTSMASVARGYQGSLPAEHIAGALVYVQPKFSRYDIGVAINQELNSLSGAGLFQIKTDDITYNPVYQGYDLPTDPGFFDVIGVRYKQVTPVRNYPPIGRWAVLRQMTDPVFPSTQALIVYGAGYPGLPLHVWYSCAFGPLTELSDGIHEMSGLPTTAIDILSVGAQIILVNAREVKRNFTETQPDPRKAAEVPPLAVANSIKGLEAWRATRVAEERTRLEKQVRYLTVR